MKKQVHTPQGILERELTDAELQDLARIGDHEARLELARKEWQAADTVDKKLAVITKLLRLI